MPDAQSEILIVINGQAQGLTEALQKSSGDLKVLGGSAEKANVETRKLGEGEKKAEVEARSMAEAVKIAAEGVDLLGIESGRSAGKLFMLRDAATDFTRAMGGMKGALAGGALLTGAFAAASFVSESIKDAMKGEQATAALNNALKKTPALAKQVSEEIEKGAAGWAKYGQSVADVKSAVARGAALGVDPRVILENRKGVEDLARAMGGAGGAGGAGLMAAMESVTKGGERAGRVLRLLNLDMVTQRRLTLQLSYQADPTKRFQMIVNAVEKSGLADVADAQAGTAAAKFSAFSVSLENLRESVGTNLLPAVTDMAQALTGLIGGANSLLAGMGGLSKFLQATWKPILIGGTAIFIGLKLAHTRLGEYLRSTFLGDVGTSTKALAEEGVQAVRVIDDLNSIPKDVVTTALFNAAGASGIKDAYLANLARIPGAVIPGLPLTAQPVTKATFIPAEIPAVVTGGTAEYAGKITSWSEAAATPVETTGRVISWAEPAATPVETTGRVISWAEPAAAAVETTGKITTWAEPAATPVETTGRITSWTEGAADPVNVAGKVTAWSEPAAAAVETTGKITTWAEPAATPVSTTGKVISWTEGAADPVQVVGKVTAWSEPAAAAISTTGKITTWSEAAAAVVSTKGKITTWSEPAAATVSTTGKITTWSEPAAATVSTTGKITTWSEAAATPVSTTGKVTSWAEHAATPVSTTGHVTSWSEATPPPVNVKGTVTSLNLGSNAHVAITGEKLMVTPTLDPNVAGEIATMRARVQQMVNAGGPVTMKVRPQWVGDAAQGLRAGLAGGVALGITEAIFNGAVTIKQASGPGLGGGIPQPIGGGGKGGASYINVRIQGPPVPVRIVDAGGIAGALGFAPGKGPTLPPMTTRVRVENTPTVKVGGGTLNVGNFPANPIKVTGPAGGTTVTMPNNLNVNAHQSGPWHVSLNPDSLARIATSIGEYALGGVLSSVLIGAIGKIPIGKALEGIKNLFNGPKGPGGGAPLQIPQWSQETLRNIEAAAKDRLAGSPLKGLNLGQDMQHAFNLAFKSLALVAPLGLALTAAFKGLKLDGKITLPSVTWDFRTVTKGFYDALVKWGPTVGQALGTIILGLLVAGVTRGRVATPALARLGIGGGPDPMGWTTDPKTHKWRQMTQKEKDAQAVRDNAADAALFKSAGTWINQQVVQSIKNAGALFKGIGEWIASTIKGGIHIPGVTDGHGAPKQDPKIDVSKGTRHDDKTGKTEVYRGGRWQEQDALGHWHNAPTPPGQKSLKDGGMAIISPLGQMASAHPAITAAMHHAAAHHAPAHHTAAHTAGHTTIHQTNHFAISGAHDPKKTAEEVAKALHSVSSAARRKTHHGR